MRIDWEVGLVSAVIVIGVCLVPWFVWKDSQKPAPVQAATIPREPYTYVVEVGGHTYLVLRAYAGYYPYGGMVHHPECPCKGAR